ncbi:hypothetical protein KAJ41_02250 [Candidatus Parcubacteria bacterium]|nr:hypothetical protein [Candidatus Parcubacteria bacterium]
MTAIGAHASEKSIETTICFLFGLNLVTITLIIEQRNYRDTKNNNIVYDISKKKDVVGVSNNISEHSPPTKEKVRLIIFTVIAIITGLDVFNIFH